MRDRLDPFLRRAVVQQEGPNLGRVFSVTRETWALSDDPKKTPPRTELMVSARTASDAAELARTFAGSFPQHGFHKPSGCWWGSDGVQFHRYAIHSGRRDGRGAMIGAALAGLAGLAVLGWVRSSRRRRQAEA